MTNAEFFKANATFPTCTGINRTLRFRFSVSMEIFKRDEKEMKSLQAQYKLKNVQCGNLMTFYKD